MALAAAATASATGTLPRPGLPVAGASVTVAPQHAAPRVFWPGDGWLRLRAPASLPLGMTLDATGGTVLLTSARGNDGGVQSESLSGGAFSVTQTAAAAPTTRLTLLGGDPAACSRAGHARPPGSDRVVRTLLSAGSGRLQVVAANVTATTTGAVWMIADRCDGTEVSVRSGRVTVRRTRAQGFGHRLVEIMRRGRSVLFAGPPPGASPALPAFGRSAPRAAAGAGAAAPPAPAPGASVTPGAPSASESPTAPSSAPAPSPEQQLTALLASVSALGLTGQPGQDLNGDLQSVETALTFGTTGATCTALGTVGQAIFENADAPTGSITPATAASLLSATVGIDAALACSAPVANDLRASNELLAAIGSVEALGIDPNVADSLTEQLGQAGQAFIVGDETDGCLDVQFLDSAIGLVELGSAGAGALTTADGQRISSQVTAIEDQLNCSTVAPSGG